ncbi:MAG: glycosyltransferase [Desulfobulbaceae bacterium]|nr:glycosyltransferase [Desulfobulbaceae bacterium]
MTRKNTKISLFLPSLRGGGAERVMVTLANGIADRGYQVDLVLAKAEGPYLKDVIPTVRVIDLGASRVLFSLLPLVRYLRKARPNALLSALNHANVVAISAVKIANIDTRIVVSERNTLSHAQRGVVSGRGKYVPWFMRWLYPAANGVVAVSSGVADDLALSIGLPRERIDVVYNPVATDDVYKRSRQPVDMSCLKNQEQPIVLAVGRLTKQKNFQTLIQAFANVRKQRRASLVILGEGELRSQLEELVRQLDLADHVALPGFVENPFAWMRASSLFVLSSAWEGFGNVLVEAMACGTPVVSTDCPSGSAEILENGKWGRLVPVGDAEALTQAILATLDETTHPDVMARAADFGVDRAVTGYLQLFSLRQTSVNFS